MRILYLFNGSRVGLLDRVRAGEVHTNGFWGMLQLPAYGVDAGYIEIEDYFPPWVTRLMRQYIPIYFIHVPLMWKFFSYDIVFTSSAFGSQLCMTLLRKIGIKRPLWVMHDFSITGILGDEKTLRQKVFGWMVRHADGIVTVGTREEKLLKKRFPHLADRIAYIPFGVDITFFAPQICEEKRQLLAVGFDPDRDWKTLFKAVDGLDISVIVATRPKRVAKLTIPSNVTITAFTPRDLVSEYACSTMVVIPLDTSTGLNDAMGCSTLFESMAMGKALIATRTHTIETYITHGENGLLVAEGDADALRGAINDLLSNPTKRKLLGDHAHTYAVKHLDAHALGSQLAEFFNRVIAHAS